MTSTHPYGNFNHTDQLLNYLGNNTLSNDSSPSLTTEETVTNNVAETRDYLNVEVHGYIPDKTIKTASNATFVVGAIIAVVGLWIVFYL